MVVLRFTASSSPYNAGDIAGFPEAAAQKLIERGVAVRHEAKPALEPALKAEALPEPPTHKAMPSPIKPALPLAAEPAKKK